MATACQRYFEAAHYAARRPVSASRKAKTRRRTCETASASRGNLGSPPIDEEDTLTAYHEAGHAVIGFALGATIDSVQLGGEADEWLPERFGDCRVNWGRVDPKADSQRQREIQTILAGPDAEMLYSGEAVHPAFHGPWQWDWRQASRIAAELYTDAAARTRVLERAILVLHRTMKTDGCWAAVAAIADELLAHEFIESDTIEEIVGFWLRHHPSP